MDDLFEAEPAMATNDGSKPSARELKKAAEANALKLLPKLIEAATWGQKEAAEAIGREIADAIESSHPSVAQKVLKQLGTQLRPAKLINKPDGLVDFSEARHGIDDVILPQGIERECRAMVTEHQRANELAQYRLAPRHKLLLYGPPGNGKTLLAEALAKELGVPFLPVKYAGLIESYLGATGKNLQRVFDYAANGPCVLFMDEFDGVAIDRGDSKDVGEIRRATNQLLILMDRLPATCMFVAATNADELLDRAIHRRFDFVLELPAPTIELRQRCAQRELDKSLTPGHNVMHLIDVVANLPLANLSALVKLCQRIRRDLVLNDGGDIQAIIDTAMAA